MSYGKTNLQGYGASDKQESSTPYMWRFSTEKDAKCGVFFCPPSAGKEMPMEQIKEHWIDGVGSMVCPTTFKMPCSLCNFSNELRAIGKTDKRAFDMNGRLYAKGKYVYNIIPYLNLVQLPAPVMDPSSGHAATHQLVWAGNPSDPAAQPKIWMWAVSGKTIHLPLMNLVKYNGDIFSPTSGTLIMLDRSYPVGVTEAKNSNILVNAVPCKVRLSPDLMPLMDTMFDILEETRKLLPTPEKLQAITDAAKVEWQAIVSGRVVPGVQQAQAVSVFGQVPGTQPLPQTYQFAGSSTQAPLNVHVATTSPYANIVNAQTTEAPPAPQPAVPTAPIPDKLDAFRGLLRK